MITITIPTWLAWVVGVPATIVLVCAVIIIVSVIRYGKPN